VKRLLLVGGGHAHVHVLRALAGARLPGTEVTLVTPYARQMYSGMVPGLVAGHYAEPQVVIPLLPLARDAGVRWVEASAVALDAAARTVTLKDGQVIGYDVASIDTGATLARDAIPGAREHALFVRPIEHFVRLLEPLDGLVARRAIDLVVIGAGAAGFELALAFAHRLRRQGDGRSRVAIVTGGPPPLAGYPASVIARGAAALRRHGVAVLPAACVAVEAGVVRLAGGARVACDAPVVAIGTGPPAWLSGSALRLDDQGFVATGATLQSLSHPEVFAAGDCASRPDAPHPKSGVHAVRAGPPLAENLRRFIGGGTLQPHRPQQRTLNLLSCGEQSAIAAWGPWSAQGRWVWWWKDRIDRAFVARYSTPAPPPRSPGHR
jgi:pyridine nucleotide-disulfide oxidoreductase family protein